MSKTVSEAIKYRRSVRKYKATPLDEEKIKNCIRNATLAPNSSNMQLWEFYHITDKEILKKLSKACFNQNAAKTAVNMVVFVTRRDKWKQRAKQNLNFLESMFDKQEKEGIDVARRRKVSRNYYKKLMPIIYNDFLGLIGVSNGFANVLGSSTWAEIYGVKHIGSIKALTTALMVFSTAFGTALFGVLIDKGFSIEKIAIISAIYIFTSLVLLFLTRKRLNPVYI